MTRPRNVGRTLLKNEGDFEKQTGSNGGGISHWKKPFQMLKPPLSDFLLAGVNTERELNVPVFLHTQMASALADSSVMPPEVPAGGQHVFHLFVVRSQQRKELREYLSANGIGTGIHYPVPLHLTEAYQQLGYPGKGALPVAEQLAEEILSLPMYAELTDEQIESTIDAILNFAG